MAHIKLSEERKAKLKRTIRFLVIATITYNLIEAVIAITVGIDAGSSALIGFGLDSVIEVSSALAVAWQFSGGDHEKREKIALKIIALSFFALALFISYESISSLFSGQQAEHSTVGIILAAVSLVIMPFLSLAQRRAGMELGSKSAVADSKQTLLCTYLSGVLLLGLLLNSLFGFWWADPLAALIIAGFAIKEGLAAWRGDNCSPAELLFEDERNDQHDDNH